MGCGKGRNAGAWKVWAVALSPPRLLFVYVGRRVVSCRRRRRRRRRRCCQQRAL